MEVFMKRAFLGILSTIGLLAIPTSASAQSPRGFDWSGAHLGIFSGYAVGGHWKGDAADYPHQPVNGWFGGVAIGYDHQSSSGWVIGIETDFALADIKLTDNYFDAAVTSRINYLGTLRPRVGYAWGGTLIYLTGGLAYGQMEFTVNHWNNPPGSLVFQASQAQWHLGYAVGAGAEVKLLNNVSLKAEYLWIDLPTQTYTPGPIPAAFTGTARNEMGWSGNTVKVGLNWRFQ
jgi:outer membrane immunogenic protein